LTTKVEIWGFGGRMKGSRESASLSYKREMGVPMILANGACLKALGRTNRKK
jgi:hypothetical protein